MPAVRFTAEAIQQLERLDRPIAQRILKRIRWLSENFTELKPEPLTGNLEGLYKLCAGDYRILYTASDTEVIVHLVGHRREIYRDR